MVNRGLLERMTRDFTEDPYRRQTEVYGFIVPTKGGEFRLDCYALNVTVAHGVRCTKVNMAWSDRDWFRVRNIYRGFMGSTIVVFSKDEERRRFPDYGAQWYGGKWGRRCRAMDGASGFFMKYIRYMNLEALAETKYRYCGFEHYTGDMNIIEYLRVWREFPQVETMSKFGLSSYVVRGFLRRMAGNRKLRDFFRANAKELAEKRYTVNDVVRACANGWTLERARTMNEAAAKCRGVPKCVDRVALYAYLAKNGIDAADYLHYCSLCEKAKTAMDGFGVAFPKDFHRAVANVGRRIERERRRADRDREVALAGFRERFERRVRKGKGSLIVGDSLVDGPWEAVIPVTRKDFETEGRRMNNCIGTYFARCADGETGVFFLRKGGKRVADVEFSPRNGKVEQCRERFNREASKDVFEVARIVGKVASKALKGRKRKVAA